MNAILLRDRVIVPVLYELDLYSESAVNLLLGNAAQESHLCELRQWGYTLNSRNGAFGLHGMELLTHNSLYEDYLAYRYALRLRVEKFRDKNCSPQMDLMSNPFYATAMARIKYLTVKEALPAHNDIEGLADYWKKYYNTYEGKGTREEFIRNYNKYIQEI